MKKLSIAITAIIFCSASFNCSAGINDWSPNLTEDQKEELRFLEDTRHIKPQEYELAVACIREMLRSINPKLGEVRLHNAGAQLASLLRWNLAHMSELDEDWKALPYNFSFPIDSTDTAKDICEKEGRLIAKIIRAVAKLPFETFYNTMGILQTIMHDMYESQIFRKIAPKDRDRLAIFVALFTRSHLRSQS